MCDFNKVVDGHDNNYIFNSNIVYYTVLHRVDSKYFIFRARPLREGGTIGDTY
jgi:hypothetical protein